MGFIDNRFYLLSIVLLCFLGGCQDSEVIHDVNFTEDQIRRLLSGGDEKEWVRISKSVDFGEDISECNDEEKSFEFEITNTSRFQAIRRACVADTIQSTRWIIELITDEQGFSDGFLAQRLETNLRDSIELYQTYYVESITSKRLTLSFLQPTQDQLLFIQETYEFNE